MTLVGLQVVRFLGMCEENGTELLHCPSPSFQRMVLDYEARFQKIDGSAHNRPRIATQWRCPGPRRRMTMRNDGNNTVNVDPGPPSDRMKGGR